MQICSKEHDYICHTSGSCPLCAAKERIEILKQEAAAAMKELRLLRRAVRMD